MSKGSKDGSGLFYCPQQHIQLAKSLISAFLNAILLVGAILSLPKFADKAISRG